MNETIMAIIAGISLVFNFIQLKRNRSILTVKVLKYGIITIAQNEMGDTWERDIDRINAAKGVSTLYVDVIFSNKGEKKTTVNEVRLVNKMIRFNELINDELIALDVGDSVKKRLKYSFDNYDVLNGFLFNPAELRVIDNKEKVHKRVLGKVEI